MADKKNWWPKVWPVIVTVVLTAIPIATIVLGVIETQQPTQSDLVREKILQCLDSGGTPWYEVNRYGTPQIWYRCQS